MPDKVLLAAVRAPKSVAFPVEAMVIYCITLVVFGELPRAPPAKRPLVDEAAPDGPALAASKFPKSVALPAEAIVT